MPLDHLWSNKVFDLKGRAVQGEEVKPNWSWKSSMSVSEMRNLVCVTLWVAPCFRQNHTIPLSLHASDVIKGELWEIYPLSSQWDMLWAYPMFPCCKNDNRLMQVTHPMSGRHTVTVTIVLKHKYRKHDHILVINAEDTGGSKVEEDRLFKR